MKIRSMRLFLPILVFSALSTSPVFSAEIDCSKFTESLCSSIKAKGNTDTIYVNVFLKLSVGPSCFGTRQSPTPGCGYDSAYWKAVKAETDSIYTKYGSKMLDAMNPAQKLPHPGDSTGAFYGAIMTKSDIIEISKESSVLTVEQWFHKQPDGIFFQRVRSVSASEKNARPEFLINGRKSEFGSSETKSLVHFK